VAGNEFFAVVFLLPFMALALRLHLVKAAVYASSADATAPDYHDDRCSGAGSHRPRPTLAERGPIIDEVTALLEKVAPTIGGLDRIGFARAQLSQKAGICAHGNAG